MYCMCYWVMTKLPLAYDSTELHFNTATQLSMHVYVHEASFKTLITPFHQTLL